MVIAGKQNLLKLTAKDYVQDGLISHFDGIENVGYGLSHNSNSLVWVDLKGGVTCTLVDGYWGGTFLQNNYDEISALFSQNTPIWKTLEVVFEIQSVSCGLLAWSSNYSGYGLIASRDYGRLITTDNNKNPQPGIPVFIGFGSVAFEIDENKNVVKKFKNGEIEYTENKLTDVYSAGPYGLAGSTFSYRCPACKYYGIRVYNRHLTDAEIAHNYVVDKARFNLQ